MSHNNNRHRVLSIYDILTIIQCTDPHFSSKRSRPIHSRGSHPHCVLTTCTQPCDVVVEVLWSAEGGGLYINSDPVSS